VYQARPRYGGRSGFEFGFSDTTGAEIPVEVGWEPRFGPGMLQGHYMAGVLVNTSNTPDLLPANPGHSRRTSFYLLADQMIVRTGETGTDGLILIGGWTHGDPDTSIFRDFAFVGTVGRGLVHGRPGDSFQLLASYGAISDKLTVAQELAEAQGQPLPSGFPPAPGSFGAPAVPPGVQTSQMVAEVNYGFKAAAGVTLVPDVQFVGHPGATKTVPDALVLAGRLEVNF
jgi:porin